MRLKLMTAAAIVLPLMTTPALGQERTVQALWEIGAFGLGVSQQAYPGSSEQVTRGLVVPTLIYRGKYFRAGEGGASLRAVKTPTFEFDVGFAGAFGSGGRDIPARRGMPRIGTMVEFGPRLKWNLWSSRDGASLRAEFPVRGVFDLSNSFASRGIAAEPELQYSQRNASGWNYSASVSALAGDVRLNETFYGVAPVYANPTRPVYHAGAGLIALRVSARVSRSLRPDWRLFLFGNIDDVSFGKNADSPLVTKKTGGSVGFGLLYTWKRSASKAYE